MMSFCPIETQSVLACASLALLVSIGLALLAGLALIVVLKARENFGDQ